MAEGPLVQLGGGAAPSSGPVILAKGFRPFFLLAGVWAVLTMVIWLLALSGRVDLGTYFGGTYWHAHEMVFGFTVAVIAGFLLTAVGNWTARETAVGMPLAGLALLWIVGRVVVLFAPQVPRPWAALVDLAFLPALALACARPIVATANRRNYQFVFMLAALFAANLGMHLGALGVAPVWIRRGAWVGVDVVIAMIVVMSARIVPMFTRNATGIDGIRNLPNLDRAARAGAFLVVVCEAVGLDERLIALVSVVTGILVALRSTTWGTRHTVRHPLLWVLHAGHAFVALGLVLRCGPFVWPAFGPSPALHALTAGAIGMLTLGMMARVALGHSGRTLTVGRPMTLSFALLGVAALVRVFGPLLGPAGYLHAMLGAGSLFAVSFAIFVAVYAPILLEPRVDGKPG